MLHFCFLFINFSVQHRLFCLYLIWFAAMQHLIPLISRLRSTVLWDAGLYGLLGVLYRAVLDFLQIPCQDSSSSHIIRPLYMYVIFPFAFALRCFIFPVSRLSGTFVQRIPRTSALIYGLLLPAKLLSAERIAAVYNFPIIALRSRACCHFWSSMLWLTPDSSHLVNTARILATYNPTPLQFSHHLSIPDRYWARWLGAFRQFDRS